VEKSKVEPDRPQVIIRRKRIACWIIRATDIYSEYVITYCFFHYNKGYTTRLFVTSYAHCLSCNIIHLRVSLPSGLPLLLRVCYVPRPSHSPCLETEYLVKDTNCGGPGSSVGIATKGCTVRDRIPVGTRFSAPVQTGPRAYPASCTVSTGSFPGVDAAGAWG